MVYRIQSIVPDIAANWLAKMACDFQVRGHSSHETVGARRAK
jgi:hypothetical protein